MGNVLFYGTIDVFPRLVIAQFSHRLCRTFCTGRSALTFPFRLITGPARSPASAGISISPFAPKGATSPRVLINCAALCSVLCRLLPPLPCTTIAIPFSSVFSSFYSARAQLPRRVSPIGITGGASENASENATALSLPESYRMDLRDFRKIAKVVADRGFG